MVKWVAIALALYSVFIGAEEKYSFESEAQRKVYLELVAELRCPKCQNQNIADSNAMISEDMKRKVHQLVLEGKSKSDVIDFMKQRYGEFVHYQPPLTAVTIWLYLVPLIFIFATALIVYGKRKASNEVNQAAIQKAEKALKDLK